MELPFPGMDPYLEAPHLWPDVHHRLITAISDQLAGQLPAQYTSVITPYITMESIEIAPIRRVIVPDVAVLERDEFNTPATAVAIVSAPLTLTAAIDIPTRYARLEIRATDGDVLITAIELLSPANKRPGVAGADMYESKRQELFQSAAHLLEIDLLRAGQRPQLTGALPDEPYFIFLSRAAHRPLIDVWPLPLHAAIPIIPVPLRFPDADIPLDLGLALRQCYANAHYERRIDYRHDPPPPSFDANTRAWIDVRLREQHLRP